MENLQTTNPSNALDNFFNIAFDPATRGQIRQAAVWARISALCAFIGYGVALVVAIFASPENSTYSVSGGQITTVTRSTSLLGALIAAAIGTLYNFYLYRFATSTVRGMDSMDNINTNKGLDSLRIYFKILGVLVIIGISFMVLALLFGILVGASRL